MKNLTCRTESLTMALLVCIAGLIASIACGLSEVAEPTPIATPAPAEVTPTPQSVAAPTQQAASSADGGVAVAIGEGTTARYIIGEQLANRDLPNDAIGETSNVSGSIVFDADGRVLPELSTLVVDVSTLTSDSIRRDNYLRGNSLETATYPEARFVVNDVAGLPWPLPNSGRATFTLAGDFTVRDVTRPVNWEVDAEFGPRIVGQAVTDFTFDDFEMSKPRLAFILSLNDEIRLELDFTASVDTTP